MELDKEDIRYALNLIVGTWRPEFLVNGFSDDLAHIPAAEFKSDDGRDFSALRFEFFEDHTALLTDESKNEEHKGTWEQTDRYEFRVTFEEFLNIPDSTFKENAEKYSVQDGRLVFAIGFIAVALEKVADGVVTEEPKEPDIGEREPSPEDLKLMGIVGRYRVKKMITCIGDRFDFFTREEAEEDQRAQIAAGSTTEEEMNEQLSVFDLIVEFTEDHRVIQWAKIPAGVSQAEIDEALKAGHIKEVRDGMFAQGNDVWKALDGKYYYDTGSETEVLGEKQSSWVELTFDEEGLMPFAMGMMKLEKI